MDHFDPDTAVGLCFLSCASTKMFKTAFVKSITEETWEGLF